MKSHRVINKLNKRHNTAGRTLATHVNEIQWFVIGWIAGFVMAGVASANGWLVEF